MSITEGIYSDSSANHVLYNPVIDCDMVLKISHTGTLDVSVDYLKNGQIQKTLAGSLDLSITSNYSLSALFTMDIMNDGTLFLGIVYPYYNNSSFSMVCRHGYILFDYNLSKTFSNQLSTVGRDNVNQASALLPIIFENRVMLYAPGSPQRTYSMATGVREDGSDFSWKLMFNSNNGYQNYIGSTISNGKMIFLKSPSSDRKTWTYCKVDDIPAFCSAPYNASTALGTITFKNILNYDFYNAKFGTSLEARVPNFLWLAENSAIVVDSTREIQRIDDIYDHPTVSDTGIILESDEYITYRFKNGSFITTKYYYEENSDRSFQQRVYPGIEELTIPSVNNEIYLHTKTHSAKIAQPFDFRLPVISMDGMKIYIRAKGPISS